MSTALRFVGLDLRALRPYARGLALTLVIMTVFTVLPSRNPYAVLPPLMLGAVIVGPQYLFAADERSDLDTLYTVLGVPRRAVVAGRYLTVALLEAVLTLLGLATTAIAAAALRVPLELSIVAGMTMIAVAVLCLVFACQLPLFFAVGYTAARPYVFVVPIVAFVGGFLVLGAGLVPDAGPLLLSALQHLGTVPAGVLTIAVSAGLLVASAELSQRLYARRDL
ncbi:ABC-2 transporter permease [Raineyella sp. W15-4]|uniref:ABC-2 transporter permease n=1 Tax=Raineyella sp. W15-4 TaxID=3081651 RepID=UPI00295478C8|nr:ABC-2 transporter permease [Raineyella sp. W15-4]WOQ18699.1 ABC-2 transporter permease [Raineyella sp. W15-4]